VTDLPAATFSPARPDVPTGGGRWPFRWIGSALAVTAFGAGIPTPLYSVYEQQYHFSSGILAAIFGAYTVGVWITMIFVAPLSDAIGRKPVLYLGMALTAASGIAFVLASGTVTLALARIISGLSVGATTSTATASMASLEPNADQHHVARVSVAANFGGVASGILLSGFLVQYGPAPTPLVSLVLVVASLVGVGLVAVTRETVRDRRSDAELHRQQISVPGSVRGPFWVAAGALAAGYSIYGLFGALSPTFVRAALDARNAALGGGVGAVLFGVAALAQLGLGRVRDRRSLLEGLPLIVGAIVIFVVSLPLRSLPLLLAGAAGMGIGVGFAFMGSVTLIDRVAPSEVRGQILSAYFVVGYLSLAVPTIGVGVAAD
jgi:MFS family permease